jgi:hypothetical protein
LASGPQIFPAQLLSSLHGGGLFRIADLLPQRPRLEMEVGTVRRPRPEPLGRGDDGKSGCECPTARASPDGMADEEFGEADGTGVGRSSPELRGQ